MTGRRLVLATPTSGSPTSPPQSRARSTATRPATNACTSRPGRARVDGVRSLTARRRLRAHPPGDDAPLGPRSATSRCAATPSRPTATSVRRSAICRVSASCWSTPRTANGICTGRPRRCSRWDRRGDLRQAPRRRSARHRRHPYVVPASPVRRRRLGRLPVPVHVQHQRLRADHRPGAPAAAGSPGLRRANFVVCNFVPRKVDYHPLAIPVPYYHSNVDSDEVMFYVGGDYEARKGSGIGQGSVSLHPGGHSHGPQPGAVEALARRGVLRRAGRHGGHVPAAGAGRGRPRQRGPGVRVELGRTRAAALTDAPVPDPPGAHG